MAGKDVVGRRGEELAAEFLGTAGYEILARNWRCAEGEIDLVAREGETTVVVEVKTRSGLAFGHPLEAITPVKLARLRRLAGAWCEAAETPVRSLRIDVIGVVAVAGRDPIIEHVVGVFR